MRTTLTLDEDVSAALARRRADRGTTLRDEVNELLRVGLEASGRSTHDASEGYELPTFDPGRVLLEDPKAWRDLLDEEDIDRELRRT